ncbi:MAG: cphB [Cyanobacteria bacterium RYN_339]|nr:cphB [Cyanobacteria bacterium RYN_339]
MLRRNLLVVLASFALVGCGVSPSAAAVRQAGVAHAASVTLAGGPLMFIGGGKDQDEIMKAFMELAGGNDQPVLIFPLASDDPAKSGKAYVDYLGQLGATHVKFLVPHGEPTAAEAAEVASSHGMFWSGGDQARIFAALTPGWRAAIAGAWHHGAVVAGTSAGAMVWGKTAILGGDPMATAWSGEDPAKDGVQLGAGLGFAPDLVVDTHFSQRGRVPRLTYAVAKQPGSIGLGVDPETTAIVKPDGSVTVRGHGTVSLIHVPAQAVKAPMSLRGVRLDMLSAGDTTAL